MQRQENKASRIIPQTERNSSDEEVIRYKIQPAGEWLPTEVVEILEKVEITRLNINSC